MSAIWKNVERFNQSLVNQGTSRKGGLVLVLRDDRVQPNKLPKRMIVNYNDDSDSGSDSDHNMYDETNAEIGPRDPSLAKPNPRKRKAGGPASEVDGSPPRRRRHPPLQPKATRSTIIPADEIVKISNHCMKQNGGFFPKQRLLDVGLFKVVLKDGFYTWVKSGDIGAVDMMDEYVEAEGDVEDSEKLMEDTD